jgi:hypothetical protein
MAQVLNEPSFSGQQSAAGDAGAWARENGVVHQD